MQPKTEELLYVLCWTGEVLIRPTFRNLTDSFEIWAYRNGLMPQLARLERQRYLERHSTQPRDRLYRLTEQGRLHVLGGRDPDAQWGRTWDGLWRIVLFDVPTGKDAHRKWLRRYLREHRFGCLQGSAWITPDPLSGERQALAGGAVNVGSLILLEGKPCAGESDQEIVKGAWNFDVINQRYSRHMDVLKQFPENPLRDVASAKIMQRWAAMERQAWLTAVSMDPLLPQGLLPPEYPGRENWRRRKEVLAEAGRLMRGFKC